MRFRDAIAALALAGTLFAGLAWWLHAQQAGAVRSALLAASLDAPPREPADVTSALRAMKLVTVEIDTRVTVERSDRGWRGDVSAKVTVPVRLSYGTDLSKMKTEAVGFSALGAAAGTYVVRVPRPTRVATEVFSEKERADVEAGWLRLRSRAGEYYLGLARRDAPEAARDLTLRPEDAERVERVTREQVETLVRTIVGKDARVRVVFDEAP